MNKTIHRAQTRGHANHGWLDTYHTFSFAGYYDPRRIHFGALRVLKGVEDIAICRLTESDVVRHVIVQRIIKAYEVDEERKNRKDKQR